MMTENVIEMCDSYKKMINATSGEVKNERELNPIHVTENETLSQCALKTRTRMWITILLSTMEINLNVDKKTYYFELLSLR